MAEIQLRDPEGLLRGTLKKDQGFTYTTKPLLAPGENYGSTMLAVDVKVTGEESERHYVAKMCPPTDLLKEIFNTATTFKTEMALYTDLVPTLQRFQREHGVTDVINFFSQLEGARIGLNPQSDEVDSDAVMLFKNLKYEGYEVVDRYKGFDLECTELIIKDLATFHAVPLALKLQNPARFEANILKHLHHPFETKVKEDFDKNIVEIIIKILQDDKDLAVHASKIREAFAHGKKLYMNKPPPREPFATLVHNDYWVNNTLLKFENGRPVKNVMVDFQILEYNSPADDVIFFLYSSVNPKVLSQNYDGLIALYHNTFMNALKRLHCDVERFSFELFQEELDAVAPRQFYHVMFMLMPILAKKGAVKELDSFTEDDMIPTELAEEFPEKVRFNVQDFAKRGWI